MQTFFTFAFITEVAALQMAVHSKADPAVGESGIQQTSATQISIHGFDVAGYYNVDVIAPYIGFSRCKMQYTTIRKWAKKQIEKGNDVNWSVFPWKSRFFGSQWEMTMERREKQFNQWFDGLSAAMKTQFVADLPLFAINIEVVRGGKPFQIHVSGDNKINDIIDAIRSTLKIPAWDARIRVTFDGRELDGSLHAMGVKEGDKLQAEILFPVVTYANGDTYEGQVKNKKQHGRGTYICSSGERYEGQFENGGFAGQGAYIFPSGARHEGQWQNDVRHGEGTYFYLSGARYEGQWQNDVRHGTGTYIWPDGVRRLEQEWKNGVLHQNGPLRRLEQEWKNGVLHQNDPLIDLTIEDTRNRKQFHIHVPGSSRPEDIQQDVRSHLNLPKSATVDLTFGGQKLTGTLDEMGIEDDAIFHAVIENVIKGTVRYHTIANWATHMVPNNVNLDAHFKYMFLGTKYSWIYSLEPAALRGKCLRDIILNWEAFPGRTYTGKYRREQFQQWFNGVPEQTKTHLVNDLNQKLKGRLDGLHGDITVPALTSSNPYYFSYDEVDIDIYFHVEDQTITAIHF